MHPVPWTGADADRARDGASRRGERSDQEAGGEETERRFRRAAGGRDESRERLGGMGVERRLDRPFGPLLDASLRRTRLGPGGGPRRLFRPAFAMAIGAGEPGVAVRGLGRPRSRRPWSPNLRGAAAAIRRRRRDAARLGSTGRPLHGASRRLARHREHPHYRQEGEPKEPVTVARRFHVR